MRVFVCDRQTAFAGVAAAISAFERVSMLVAPGQLAVAQVCVPIQRTLTHAVREMKA